jgi:hypothetical protein
MARLHLALNDGFTGDTVVVRLDGREIYRKGGVKTDLRISRADGAEADAPDGEATLEVEARGRTASVRVDAAARPHVGIDMTPDGEPRIRQQAEPFAYL